MASSQPRPVHDCPLLFTVRGRGWSVPLLLLLATGGRRLRGVAPITACRLVSVWPRAVDRCALDRLGGEHGSLAALAVDGGAQCRIFLVALPTGWFAWSRLKAVAGV
jgi:hypothetical protein